MKKHCALIVACWLLSLLVACSDRRAREWPSTDSHFDELNLSLDSIYRTGHMGADGSRLLEEMERIASHTADDRQAAMTLYWKTVVDHRRHLDSAGVWIDRALALTDSASYPYLHARLALERGKLGGHDYIATYAALRGSLHCFTLASDDYMRFVATQALGSFHLLIRDLQNFQRYNQEVEQICKRLHADTLVAKSQLNYALYYIQTGDSVKAAEIIDELLRSPLVRPDSAFVGLLYFNLAQLRNAPDSLQRAIDINPTFRNSQALRYTIQFGMARMYDEKGEKVKCDSMLEFLAPLVMEHGDDEAKMYLYAMLADRSREAGDIAQAYDYLALSMRHKDALSIYEARASVADFGRRDDISRMERDYARERTLSRTRWLAVLSAVVMVMAVVLFLLRDRQRKLQMAKLKAEAEMATLNLSLEREKRSMLDMGVAMSERDSVIHEINDILDELYQDGKIDSTVKTAVAGKIKLSQSFQQEYSDFKRSYERVRPDFVKRLQSQYAGLSDGDVRLALYIAAGLSSKQIAQAMHLQPDSVKKNRQRLRQHMGLDAGQSLGQTLRALL